MMLRSHRPNNNHQRVGSLFVSQISLLLLQILLHQKIISTNAFIHGVTLALHKNRPVSSIKATTNNYNHGEIYRGNHQDESTSLKIMSSFDPLDIPSDAWDNNNKFTFDTPSLHHYPHTPLPTAAATLATLTLLPTTAAAAPTVDFNPQNFQPICPASDSIYRLLKATSITIIGEDNMAEYGPIVAGGLLRIRLELCVVESFFGEAVGPFIEDKGLSWVLPLHETVETFAAGTIFAFTTTFILVGSTKIVSVVMTFIDVFFGGPSRTLGGFVYDRVMGVPVTWDVGVGKWKMRVVGPKEEEIEKRPMGVLKEDVSLGYLILTVMSGGLKAFGETSKVLQEVIEAFDLFVGRYLAIYATAYVGLKFVHFKVFPDFP